MPWLPKKKENPRSGPLKTRKIKVENFVAQFDPRSWLLRRSLRSVAGWGVSKSIIYFFPLSRTEMKSEISRRKSKFHKIWNFLIFFRICIKLRKRLFWNRVFSKMRIFLPLQNLDKWEFLVKFDNDGYNLTGIRRDFRFSIYSNKPHYIYLIWPIRTYGLKWVSTKKKKSL